MARPIASAAATARPGIGRLLLTTTSNERMPARWWGRSGDGPVPGVRGPVDTLTR
ncbi:hypothetical protein ACFPM0_00810 [Pseudonocardia sulfidoxydans]|uniref:hypothetical protein n=1 Tax=Pseudonocardia sulfidoxydans TaxID=54011 RepID=UPI003619B2AB